MRDLLKYALLFTAVLLTCLGLSGLLGLLLDINNVDYYGKLDAARWSAFLVVGIPVIAVISRLIPGVFGNPESIFEESHSQEGYLEYPNFTKPAEWRGISVPEVLLSGNHAEIAKWRRDNSNKKI